MTFGTVTIMDTPKFARYLPSGRGLDRVFVTSVQGGNRLKLKAAPSHELIVEHWGSLDETDRITLASVVTDLASLTYICENVERRANVCVELLKNRKLPVECIPLLLPHVPVQAVPSLLYTYRTSIDLARICSANPLVFVGVSGEQIEGVNKTFYEKLGNGVGDADDTELFTNLIGLVHADYRESFMKGLLENKECAYNNLDVQIVNDVMLADGEDFYGARIWGTCGKIAGFYGNASRCVNLLDKVKSPSMRANMFVGGVPLVRLLHGLDRTFKTSVLKQIALLQAGGECGHLNLQDTRAALLSNDPDTLHSLKYEQDALDWLIANATSQIVGAIIWQSTSDTLIATVLRSNHESHAWASKHIWKLNTIWPKLGVKHKSQITETLTDLHSLPTGNVREWIIEEGDAKVVQALHLKKSELKKLVSRLEDQNYIEISWIVAIHAERPKDRVSAAVRGMETPDWAVRLPDWLNSTGSGEVLKFWNSISSETKIKVSPHLIAAIRVNEDTAWVSRIVHEITTQWNKAPEHLQEAAAAWIDNASCGSQTTWDTLTSLYSEWDGTLEDLIKVSEEL